MKPLFNVTLLAALICTGCSSDEPLTTDMHEDFDHEHKHQHSSDDDHEHEHGDDFKGSHSHGHTHGHRHGNPPHGGRIVSIGHTHSNDEIAHFHAEIMPLTDGKIRIHILSETDDGQSIDHSLNVTEIPALISIKGKEATTSESTFKSVGEGAASEFVLQLPETLSEGEKFSVVVPKIKLGGLRQNFSFTVSRKENVEKTGAPKSQEEAEKPSDETADEVSSQIPMPESTVAVTDSSLALHRRRESTSPIKDTVKVSQTTPGVIQ